ncbi:MAG: thioredoxin [Bacteroidales bacterium]|jgi:thioredoxin 1|nr:thioredoxin [Bacteroidales bacterium]MDD4209371.1 thioredoxin [Bacteroidales bacterium]MDY0015685.1 thioredoxin [Bacteroidales bacterium]
MALEILDSNWEEITKKNPLVVIDFWAEWCGPCRMITPIVEEIAQEYNNKAIIGKVNIDNNPNVTMHFGIKNIPTLLFIKNGELVDKHVGVIRKPDLIKKIDDLL